MIGGLHRHWFIRALVVIFAMQVTVNAVRPTVSYRALDLGADAVALGVIAAGFATISLVCAIPVGRMVDRRGETIFILCGLGLVCGVSFALVAVGTVWALFVTQAALGLGQVLTTIGTQAMIANSASAGRESRFSTFTVVVSLGQLAGPALAGVMTDFVPFPDAWAVNDAMTRAGSSVFVAGGVVALVGVLVALANDRSDTTPSGARQDRAEQVPLRRGVGQVLRQPNAPHAMLASVATITTVDLLVAYLPAFGEEHGLSSTAVGILLAVRAGASLISRIFLTTLTQILGRGRLLALATFVPAVALAPLVAIDSLPVLVVLMVCAGLGLGIGQPLSLIWITDTAPTSMRGTAVGVRMSGNRLGQVLIPVAVGGVVGSAGVGAVFVAMAVMLAGSSLLTTRGSFTSD